MDIMSLVPYALVVLVLYTLFQGVVTVRQGFTCTVERFGKYTRTLEPGFHFMIPYLDRIGRRVNVMETVLDIPPQEVISADNAGVKVDGLCFFVVVNAAKASYEVNDLDYALRNLAMTNIRTVLGSMELDKMLSARDDINNRLLDVVDRAAEPWGVKVTRIEIKNIEPPADLVDAMANQMKSTLTFHIRKCVKTGAALRVLAVSQ